MGYPAAVLREKRGDVHKCACPRLPTEQRAKSRKNGRKNGLKSCGPGSEAARGRRTEVLRRGPKDGRAYPSVPVLGSARWQWADALLCTALTLVPAGVVHGGHGHFHPL